MIDRRRPAVRSLFCCAAIISGLTSVAPSQEPSGDARRQEALELSEVKIKAIDGSQVVAEFGHITVPENRGKQDSRRITLAFLRVRSPLDNPGPPVFMLAGGPGGSGIQSLRSTCRGGPSFLAAFGGDLIAFDQRGVGESDPNLETDTSYDLPIEDPGDPRKLLKIMREVGAREAASWRERGVDLSGYTTAESADDIEDLRRALGYEKIVLWGGSYGSHLAMATLRRHEPRIARAVLLGPEGPNHTIKLPSYTQTGLESIARLAAEHEPLARQVPDMLESLRKVLARLDDAPVYVEIDGVNIGISKFDVQRYLARVSGQTRTAVYLPAMIHMMENGDFERMARTLMRSRQESSIGSAMTMIMDHASGMTAERASRIADEAQECLLGDAVNFPFPQLAEAWGAPDLGDEFRGPLKVAVPVLFIVGDLDSRTPIRNAEELMRDMPNSHLVVVENAAHDLRWFQREIVAVWRDFLAGKEVTTSKVSAPRLRFAPINKP